MNKLSSIIAKGLVAQDNFVANLAVAVEANHYLAHILADATTPTVLIEEVQQRTSKDIVDFKVLLTADFQWQVTYYYKSTRYYASEELAATHNYNNGVRAKDDEHPVEGYYIESSYYYL